jgi:hypothetical protein
MQGIPKLEQGLDVIRKLDKPNCGTPQIIHLRYETGVPTLITTMP